MPISEISELELKGSTDTRLRILISMISTSKPSLARLSGLILPQSILEYLEMFSGYNAILKDIQ